MGSNLFEALREQGQDIERGGGESCVGYPEAFTVIGADITAEKLLKLYPDESKAHARARAIIAGVADKTRVSKAPPDAFIATLRNGVHQPIALANLGVDRKGRTWIVVALGRQRTLGLRIWNAAHPDRTWKITGTLKPFVHNDKASIDAELEALEANAASNVFVAEAPTTKADRAAMLNAKGRAHADIAISIGAQNATEVIYLLALADCHESVGAAADAGRIALADVAELAKHDHAEQARRVARKLAGPSKSAKATAGAARNYRLRPAQVEALVTNLGQARRTYSDEDATAIGALVEAGEPLFTRSQVAALIRRVAGEQAALDGDAELAALLGGEAESK